jgi:probable rRNA maturation factor
MTGLVDLQIATKVTDLPDEKTFTLWLDQVLLELGIQNKEMTIRLVDEAEGQQLNYQYRSKNAPTNVLSFPFEMPDFSAFEQESDASDLNLIDIEFGLLGDLVICAPIITLEAQQQNKILTHHWAHMVVHGTLHLLGYDHINDTEADHMEGLERKILQQLDIDDPYQDH